MQMPTPDWLPHILWNMQKIGLPPGHTSVNNLFRRCCDQQLNFLFYRNPFCEQYLTRAKRRWWDYLAQIIILYYINVELLGGLYFEVNIFGVTLEVVQQGLALLALPIIWLYNGERGYHKKWWQYFCYAFYPLHMLVLYLVFLLYVMLYG